MHRAFKRHLIRPRLREQWFHSKLQRPCPSLRALCRLIYCQINKRVNPLGESRTIHPIIPARIRAQGALLSTKCSNKKCTRLNYIQTYRTSRREEHLPLSHCDPHSFLYSVRKAIRIGITQKIRSTSICSVGHSSKKANLDSRRIF